MRPQIHGDNSVYLVKHINVRKQAIPDKLQGTVATYLSGRVLNNQIKKGLLLSLSVKKLKSANIWQARTWLSRALCSSCGSN